MPGPSNPFGGLAASQRNGGSAPPGRGRGAHTRSAYQVRNFKSQPEARPPSRGRGAGVASKYSRGVPAGGRNAQIKNRPAVKQSSSVSPFAQLKQNNPPLPPDKKPDASFPRASSSLFAGITKGSHGFGAPSTPDGSLAFSADAIGSHQQRFPPGYSPNQSGTIPVEDARSMGIYHDRYEKLKVDRARQREQAIREGQMADPNQPMSLKQAITPVGTCTDMCPEFERVERIVQKMVDKSEKFLHPSTKSYQNMETKMLKRFRRSAAGYDEQIPSDIRTPRTLLQTMNYLIRYVIGGPEPLGLVHKFVWDRTRSIRNDFSIQQLTQGDHVQMAVTCLERIARFHIISLHLLSNPLNQEPFDHHQEREQLNNTLLSLMYYYDDNRGRVSFPNEDEFRAYYIVFSIHAQRPDLEAHVQKWPSELRQSPRVQVALELFAAASNTWEYQGTLDAKRPNVIAQGFYSRFLSLVDSPSVPYLMACVAEIYFNHVRQTAIRAIWKGYCRYPVSQQQKNDEWTIDELTEVLYFDDKSQTLEFCKDQDLEFAENGTGQLYLNWANRPIDSIEFTPSSQHSFSQKHVEPKRGRRTLAAIILGLSIKLAAMHGMIDPASLIDHRESLQLPSLANTPEQDDELFVRDDENETKPPQIQINGVLHEEDESRDSSPSASSIDDVPRETPQQPILSGLKTKQQTTPQPTRSREPKQTSSFLFTTPATNSTASPIPSNPFAFLSSSTSSSQPVQAPHNPSTAGIEVSPTSTARPNPVPIPPVESDASAGELQSKDPEGSLSLAKTAKPFSIAAAILDAASLSSSGPTAQKPVSLFEPVKSNSVSPTFSFFPPIKTPDVQFEFAQNQLSSLEDPKKKKADELLTQTNDGVPVFEPEVLNSQINGAVTLSAVQATTNQPTAISGMSRELESSEFSPPKAVSSPTFPSPDGALHLKQQGSNTTDGLSKSPAPLSKPPASTPAILRNQLDSSQGSTKSQVEPSALETINPESPNEEVSLDSKAYESPQAWIKALRGLSETRRQTFPYPRKRALDEHEEPLSADDNFKVPKIPKPTKKPSHRASMARVSIAPLPTLPILEEVKNMTETKSSTEVKPAVPARSLVDDDEILLSAARIAAESLRSGPSLLESVPSYPTPSFTSRGFWRSPSLESDGPRSQSPHYRINGYDVALAPDTPLGLGRTMSRTEQRIRLTGGKGLAYKPLKVTPKKKKGKS